MLTLKEQILDIIFPRRCLSCDILLGNEPSTSLESPKLVLGESQSYVCRHCLRTISLAKGFACAFCKSPVRAGKTCVYCIKDHFLDRLLVAASYENPLVEKIIKTAKYRFVRLLSDDMADLMIKYLKKKARWLTNIETLQVVPVPLHRKRLNWRGFNQAEIMGAKIAEHFCWPVITNALKRRSNHKPQTDMPDRLSRIENAKNLYRLNSIYADRKNIYFVNKTILLIDDVSTTGSTLNDCARALKGAGVKEVIGLVFARNKSDKKEI